MGKVIDDYLNKRVQVKDPHASHLLFSANRWELKSEIERKLQAGVTLICDRYSYSGAAYSAALGLEQEFCWSCEVLLFFQYNFILRKAYQPQILFSF